MVNNLLCAGCTGRGKGSLALFLGEKWSSKAACVKAASLLSTGTLSPLISALLWVAVAFCTAMLFFISKPMGIRPFLVSVMLRSIYTVGLGPTLILLGAANVSTSEVSRGSLSAEAEILRVSYLKGNQTRTSPLCKSFLLWLAG